MLQLIVLGNLGRDADVKIINDKQYLSFSVASTEKRANEEQTTWVSVLYPYQEALLPFLKKGQQVFVQGRLKAGIYQSQNTFGIDLSVFAQTLQLCGGKKEDATSSTSTSAALSPQPAQSNQVPYGSTVPGNSVAGNSVPSYQTVAPQTAPDPASDDALPF